MHPVLLEQLKPGPDTPPPVPERTLHALSRPAPTGSATVPLMWRPTPITLLDMLLPAHHRETYTPDELRRARILAATLVLMVPNVVLGAVFTALSHATLLAPLSLFAVAAGGLVALWLLHRRPSPSAAGWMIAALLAITSVLMVSLFGGVTGAGAIALVLAPVTSLHVAPRAGSRMTLVACTLFLVGSTVVQAVLLGPTMGLLFTAVCILAGTLSFYALGCLVERTGVLAQTDSSQVNTSLAAEVKDHRRTRERLRDTHRELMDAARRAGAAEVATGVLHNVGNGLNAVNVSAAMVDERMHSLRLERIGRLARRLDETPEIDPRLAAFAHGLFRALEDERAAAVNELRTLRQAVEHVAATVSTQQRWAQKAGVTEVVDVREMMHEVVTMIGIGEHHNIEIDLQIDGIPPIITDRHRVIQIVSNLFSNARDAVKNIDGSRRRIRLDARLLPEDKLRISVTDTGMGISQAHLHRIFEHGFTTKPTGHGFGLHASAISAKELDGTLEAHSPGRNQGSSFVLTIPVSIATQY